MTSRDFTAFHYFNADGERQLVNLIANACRGRSATTYGELVLMLTDHAGGIKSKEALKSAFGACNDAAIKVTLSYVDALLEQRNSKALWRKSPDEMLQGAGLYTMDIWKQLSLPVNQSKFQSLQSLVHSAGIVNFAAVAGSDRSSRTVIENSLKKGIFGGLFG